MRLDPSLKGLEAKKPPLARFDQVSIQELEPVGYKGFRILKSDPDFEERSIAPLISPYAANARLRF
jgi:hydrogenase maturation factor HypF (carbamoyltransferase family)